MSRKPLDLIGQRFTKLLVTEFAGFDNSNQSMFKCICDCGNETIKRGANLKRQATLSCGCLRNIASKNLGYSAKKHGLTKTSTYITWQGMKDRCTNPNSKKYKFYGGMGVKFDAKWMAFEGFLEDMGIRPENTTLDRINPFGDYTKENCRWADKETQQRNTRMNFIKESILCLR